VLTFGIDKFLKFLCRMLWLSFTTQIALDSSCVCSRYFISYVILGLLLVDKSYNKVGSSYLLLVHLLERVWEITGVKMFWIIEFLDSRSSVSYHFIIRRFLRIIIHSREFDKFDFCEQPSSSVVRKQASSEKLLVCVDWFLLKIVHVCVLLKVLPTSFKFTYISP
jgi:hypothetical protein